MALRLLGVLACLFSSWGFAVAADDFATQNGIRLGDSLESSRGMVVAAHPEAAAAGAEILAAGGNALDAIVATAFALAVVEPEASGLGGGGFLLYYDAAADQCASVNYRETAPRLSTESMYALGGPGLPGYWEAPADAQAQAMMQRIGGQAVAVPTMVAGLLQSHGRWGRLPLHRILAPAVRLAEDGFTVSQTLYSAVLNAYSTLIGDEGMAAAFLNDGLPYEPGETARRADLASALRAIAAGGADAFYRGRMASDIVRAVQSAGGTMDALDLESVRVTFDVPLETVYRGMRLVAPPLPAGGLAIFEALEILEGADVSLEDPLTAGAIHWMAEILKRTFSDRAAFLGDPAHAAVSAELLLDASWTAARRATIDPDRATPSPQPGSLESASTTHISVVDADGNAASLTQSISLFFGAHVFVPEWGILMNNTMADFDPEPGSPNSIAPGKAPLSSMSPMFLFDGNGLRLVTGSPGGRRITSTLVELAVATIDLKLPLPEALARPRFHAETDTLYVESRFGEAVLDDLAARGHPVEVRAPFDLFFGGAHAIEIRFDGAKRIFIGAADPRRAGQAAGL